MSGWTEDELERIGAAEELEISSRRADGTDRPFVPIWVVRVDGAVYVRSAYGPENGWFRRAAAAGAGRIRAGGVERAATFVRLDPGDAALHDRVDAALRAEYGRYGSILDPIVTPASRAATLRIDPEG